MAQVGDTVMVIMSHPDRKVIAWDGKEFVLERDKEKFIPFELAANYFGDPRAMGVIATTQDQKRRVGWIPDRATEVRRLRTLYGVQHGDESTIFLPDGILDSMTNQDQALHWKRIDANIPRVQMYDLETRERLYHVLEDPLGEHVTPATMTVTNEQRLQSRVDRLEDLVRTLTAEKVPGEGLVTPEGIIAPDPNAPPREQTMVERALHPERDEDKDFEPIIPDLITSRSTGASGLPADKG